MYHYLGLTKGTPTKDLRASSYVYMHKIGKVKTIFSFTNKQITLTCAKQVTIVTTHYCENARNSGVCTLSNSVPLNRQPQLLTFSRCTTINLRSSSVQKHSSILTYKISQKKTKTKTTIKEQKLTFPAALTTDLVVQLSVNNWWMTFQSDLEML